MERKPKAAPHRILTLARDLQRRKARERASAFVAEGARVVGETLRAALKDSGIGTPATRASILETLLRRALVDRK